MSEVLPRGSALQIVVAARALRLRDDGKLAEPGSEADQRLGGLGEALHVDLSPARKSRLEVVECGLQTLRISPLERWDDVDLIGYFGCSVDDAGERPDDDVVDSMPVERREDAAWVEVPVEIRHGLGPPALEGVEHVVDPSLRREWGAISDRLFEVRVSRHEFERKLEPARLHQLGQRVDARGDETLLPAGDDRAVPSRSLGQFRLGQPGS
jgi:hypothetical protein